jgi:hypothetical protein
MREMIGRRQNSQSEPQPFKLPVQYALARIPTDPNSFQPSRLYPSPASPRWRTGHPPGPAWLHEIKFDGYRIIARKRGIAFAYGRARLSDYASVFRRIRDAVAALPVDSAVRRIRLCRRFLDGRVPEQLNPADPEEPRKLRQAFGLILQGSI